MSSMTPTVDKLLDSKGDEIVKGLTPTVVNYILWHPSVVSTHFVYSGDMGLAITCLAYMVRYGLPKNDGVTDDIRAHDWALKNNVNYREAVNKIMAEQK